ncbi:thioredoxin family protein [Reichenbachiella versicolor]|uniref:thioredoxin family protein n=1 Tax=Reichenbachiella versicolor TaxID=1821036 RepID=UPI000D6E16F6|nr:thioredoxin fold domain-containing protein [Reichenbachiella versicolor]
MKKLYVLILLFLSFSASAQIQWVTLEEAQLLALKNPKPIFMDFTATWCGWCKKLDKTTFEEERVVQMLSTDYYAVKVNFDDKSSITLGGKSYDTHKELAKSFGITGLPTMVVYDSEKKKSKTIVGYKNGKALIRELK